MATISITEPTPAPAHEPADGSSCVAMYDVDWKGYIALLGVRGERSRPRIVYLDGNALLTSPSLSHEGLAWRLGQFVSTLVFKLRIPCIPARQTTFRLRKKRGGVEPDESYYLANAALVRGKTQFDLETDPPPDLVIEAVQTHAADSAVEVYRRFGVPEVWVCDDDALTILVLGKDGRYRAAARSLAFSFLSAEEIHSWVARPQTDYAAEWLADLHKWVEGTIAERSR
jgi:Uma2 family endonuclease